MTLRRAAFALSLFTILASPAFAADEPPVVQAIFKNWETQYHIKPSYKNLTTDGDAVTIEGLAAAMPMPEGGNGGGFALAVGKIELKGVADQGNGIFRIATATYSDLKVDVGNPAQGQGLSVTIPNGTSEGWYVKALGDNPTPADTFRASMNIAHKSTSGQITFTAAGQSVTADGYEMTWDGDVQTGAGKSTFKIANIAIPESVIAMMDPGGTLKQIGYTSLAFDLGGEGKFDVATDKLGFDFDMFYAGKDMGTLKLGAAAGEIPMVLMSELQKQEGGDPSKFMPLVQGIQVSRLAFRFEDQSITKRLLPFAAKMQGMDEQTLVATAGAAVQLGLTQLKNPGFTEKVVAAVNAYLKDPRSFTIVAKPAQPVTVMQVMSLDPSNPGAAIDQLGVSVSAND
jgi:hypothetical protein